MLLLVWLWPTSAFAQAEAADSGAEDDAPAEDRVEASEPNEESGPVEGDEPPVLERVPRVGSENLVEEIDDAMGELGVRLTPTQPSRPRLEWDPTWPRYRFDELVLSLGMGLIIALEEALPTRTDANWDGVIEPDTAVASALGLDSAFQRDVLEELSDAMIGLMVLWPSAIDSLLIAGLGEGAWDVAWQLSLISLEVFTINQALTVLVRLLARRERPLGRFCREEPGYSNDPVCADQPPAESFWGAHTSNAFAAASMMCLSHDMLDLYGDEWSDGLACGTAVAFAATTAFFRLMSDSEWITDVFTGAIVGTLSGLLIPWLLHYQGGARPPLSGSDLPTITFAPMMGDGLIGGNASGVW